MLRLSTWLHWPPSWSLISHQGYTNTRLCQLCILLRFDCFGGQARAEHGPLCSCGPSHLSLKQHNMTHTFANGHLLAPKMTFFFLFKVVIPSRFWKEGRYRFGSWPRNLFQSKCHCTFCCDLKVSYGYYRLAITLQCFVGRLVSGEWFSFPQKYYRITAYYYHHWKIRFCFQWVIAITLRIEVFNQCQWNASPC